MRPPYGLTACHLEVQDLGKSVATLCRLWLNSVDIFVNRDGTNYGPYQQADVELMLTEGRLLESDLVWCEGLEGWVPLSALVVRPASSPSQGGQIPATAAAAIATAALLPVREPLSKDLEAGSVQPIEADSADPFLANAGFSEQPPVIPRDTLPPIIEREAGLRDGSLLGPEFEEDLVDPEFYPEDLDFDFELPDIDFDF